MNTELTTAIEGSTYIVTSSFFDETGAAEIPTAIKWSLRDENGAIVNSKSAVSVTPASTITIILSGADLAYTSNQSKRVLTIEAVYTSTLGAGLPIKDEYDIPIRNLIGV